MVSADNLNLDCLELVFAYLTGNDLFSVSLVSKSFLAGVIPYLYRTIVYHLGNAKRYPAVMSPFETLVKHPSLAVHVHNIDIRTVPIVKATVQPKFMANVVKSLNLCTNLRTFTCTPNILPALLLPLKSHEDLRGIRVNATLTMPQADILKSLVKLQSLALDACSWNMVDALPDWTRRMSSTLTTLTLQTIQELNEPILEQMLPNLPNLTSLYVVGCAKIEHGTILRATRYTPKLQNLGLTAWDSAALPPALADLPHLRHLAVDTHIAPIVNGLPNTSSPSLWTAIIALTKTWGCPLSSITLRLSDKVTISHSLVQNLLEAHGETLEHIALVNVDVAWESVRAIAAKAKQLDRLAMHIPTKEVRAFSNVLGRSKTLQTITDMGESHTTHGSQAYLTRDAVRTLMFEVPNLRKLVTTDRLWTCDKAGGWRNRGLNIKLAKRKVACPSYWFYPR